VARRCVITKPRERGGHGPRWAAEPEKIIIIIEIYHDLGQRVLEECIPFNIGFFFTIFKEGTEIQFHN
jgi:hypothetical protein